LRGSSRGSSSTISTTPRVRFPRHVVRLVVDYFDYAAHPGSSARRAARHPTLRRLLRLCRASRCLGMSRGSSRGSSRRSSSTTPPTPCVRVPRHVARLVIRLVVDYFTYAASSVASASRADCCVTQCRLLRLAQARRRLLRLHRASGCLGTSRGSSCGSSSTTSTTPRVRVPRQVSRLVVDYFDYAALLPASARRAACHPALRRLLRLRRTSRCLSMLRGSSRGSLRCSSSTTTPMPRVRVPRHVTRLVTLLVIDYFTYAARAVALARRASCRVTHRRLLRLAQALHRLLRLCHAFGCLGTSRGSSRASSSTTSTTPRV
jgi:hypothetical protein